MSTQIIKGMPFEDYRNAPGINQSLLRLLVERSAAHVKDAMDAKAEDQDAGAARRLGTFVHQAILDDEFAPAFDRTFAVKPRKMKFSEKPGKEWRAARLAEGKLIVTGDEADFLACAGQKIMEHDFARRLFETGDPEVSIFVTDPDTGLALKGRFDFNTEGDVIPDIKSCENATEHGFRKAILRYRYQWQASFYLRLAKLAGLDKRHFVFVACEKQSPFAVACYTLPQEIIDQTQDIITGALAAFKYCSETGRWPAYHAGVKLINL